MKRFRGAAIAALILALFSHHDLSAGQAFYDVAARYVCDGITNANSAATVVRLAWHTDDGLNRTILKAYQLGSFAHTNAFTAVAPAGFALRSWQLSCCDAREKATASYAASNPLQLSYGELALKSWPQYLYLDAIFTSLIYTLRYDANGGSGSLPQDVTDRKYPDSVTLDAGTGLIRTGYSFSGWNLSADGSGAGFDAGQSVTGKDFNVTNEGQVVTLYAQWAGEEYTLTLDPGEGALAGETTVKVTNGGKYPTLPTPTRWGYKFSSWKDGNSRTAKEGGTFTYLNDASLQLSAVWSACSYVISFDANGGTGEMGTVNTKTDENAYLLKNTFTRDNCNFAGWHTNANAKSALYADEAYGKFNLSPDGSPVTLYAVWTGKPYSVRYASNGGEREMDDQKGVAGEDITLRQNAFTRGWHDFIGWNTNRYAEAAAYADGATIAGGLYDHAVDDVVNLYALWKPWKYDVSFEKNNPGYYRIIGNQAAIEAKGHNEAFALPACTYTNLNAFFVGWSTNASSRAGAADCWAAGTVVSNLVDKGECTLYPIWSVGALSEAAGLKNGVLESCTNNVWVTDAGDLESSSLWGKSGDGVGCVRSSHAYFTRDKTRSAMRLRLHGSGELAYQSQVVKYTPSGLSISFSMVVDGCTNSCLSVSNAYDQGAWIPTNIVFAAEEYHEISWIVEWTKTKNISNSDIGFYITNLVWTPLYPCTISFDSKGGSAVAQQSGYIGQKVTRPADPTRTGFDFAGWYADEELTTPWDFENDVAPGDMTLYAKWTPSVYTVTLNTNGGDCASLSSYTYGVGATLPIATKANLTFGGWFTNETFSGAAQTAIGATETGDRTFWAKWNAVFTIEEPANVAISTVTNALGEVIEPTEGKYTVQEGTPVSIVYVVEDGYKFVGNMTEFVQTVTPQNGKIASKAPATRPIQYTVVFDKNADEATGLMDSQTLTYDEAEPLSENAYAWKDHRFRGWARDASAAAAEFADGEVVENLTAVDGETVTLYAVWQTPSQGVVGELFSVSAADLGLEDLTGTLTAVGLPSGLSLKKTKSSGYFVEGVPTTVFSNATSLVYFKAGSELRGVSLNIAEAPVRPLAAALNETFDATPVVTLWPEVAEGTWTFSGWPTGLSYAKSAVKGKAEKGELYGKPTKAGVFTVTATRTVKSEATGASYKEKRCAKFTVMPGGASEIWRTSTVGETLEPFSLLNEFPSLKSVSGLPTGVSYATRAVKGKAEAGEVYGKPTKAGTFAVQVTNTDKSKEYRLWEVVPAAGCTAAIAFGDLPAKDGVTTAPAGVSTVWPVTVSEGATVSASSLPTGLSLQKIGTSYQIVGVPSKAGSFVVKLTVKYNGVTTVQYVGIAVEALPTAAVGTYYGAASTGAGCWGQAQFTLTAAGKVSGQFYADGTRIAFSATGLTACEATPPAYASKSYWVDVTYKYLKVSRVSRLRLYEVQEDCGFEAWRVELVSSDDVLAAFDAGVDAIKREFKTLPKVVAGTYSLTNDEMLAEGEYLKAKVTTAGAVTVSGKLADEDGKLVAVSLSTKLVLESQTDGTNAFSCAVTVFKKVSRKEPVRLDARFALRFPEGVTASSQVEVSPLVPLDPAE